MRDNYIYLVTPDYMLAIVKESSAYSFKIKGYSDCARASKSLVKTNQQSILGYLIVYEELPEDLTDLVRFINLINRVGDKDTVVLLCLDNDDGLTDYLIPAIKTDNINFMYTSGYDVMTDRFIRGTLFGTIISKKFKPYVDELQVNELVTSYNYNLGVKPVLPQDILLILSPVVKLDTLENTRIHDVVLKEHINDSLLAYLRLNRLNAVFGREVDVEGAMNRIKMTPNIDKVLYEIALNIIVRGDMEALYKENLVNHEDMDDQEDFVLNDLATTTLNSFDYNS